MNDKIYKMISKLMNNLLLNYKTKSLALALTLLLAVVRTNIRTQRSYIDTRHTHDDDDK